MQNKPFRFGPQNVPNSATTILNAPTIDGGVVNGSTFPGTNYEHCYILITHVRVVNTTASSVTISAAINPVAATVTAPTAFAWYASPIPATTSGTNWLDWYGRVRVDTDDFLNAISSVASGITIEGEGEIGVF